MSRSQKLSQEIVRKMETGAPGSRWGDQTLASALGVMRSTVANAMTGLVRAGIVERVAPRTYKLVPKEAAPQDDEVSLARRQELSDALGLTSGHTPPWSALLDGVRVQRPHGGVHQLPTALTEALELPYGVSIEQATECAKRLVAHVAELRAYAEGRQRTVEDLEEQLDDAIQNECALKEWKGDMEVGLRALRATLDLIDPDGRKR